MGPQEVSYIREVFGLSQRDLAKALNVAPYTIVRWETGGTSPSGLQDEVLRALYKTAMETRQKKDDEAAKAIGGLVALGIGALIFYLLTKEK